MAGKKSNFAKVSESIQKKQGISKERGDAIAATIGRKKFGVKGMLKKAMAGKRKGLRG
jgi:hypothetical protein